MIKTSLFFYVFIVSITTLHLPHFTSNNQHLTHRLNDKCLNHLQTTPNKTDPKIIQTRLDLIINQISLIEQTYKQINTLSDTEIIGNEGTLVQCKNVSEENQMYIKHALNNVDTDLWAVYFEIQQYMKEGDSGDQLAQQYQQLKQRKLTLEQTKINFCPLTKSLEAENLQNQENSFTDVLKNEFISNLNTKKNWTYGKTSRQQYQINQFQFLLNNDVVQCPLDTPFASKGKCISCGANQIFYLDTAVCGICPNGTDFNQQNHQCEVKIDTQCPGNQIFNSITKNCQCPSGLPYFDGNTCLGCFIPQYWNSKTMKCESCQKGTYYSLVNQTCLTCPTEGDFISSLSGCHDQCTLSKPYFNGLMCISCPQVFNPNTMQCEDCFAGLEFNIQKGVCVKRNDQAFKRIECDKGYVFNVQNGQCVREKDCDCPSNYVYNKETQKCECPKSLPFDTGVKCVNCVDPNSWDKELRKCLQPSSIDPVPIAKVPVYNNVTTTSNVTVLNTTSNSIESNNTFSGSTIDQVKQTCETGQVWNNVSNTCICSSTTPYRTLAGICIACNSPKMWSTSLNKCLQAQITCKSNFIYDPSTQSCICPRELPFSDGLKCQSCYLPMYWNNLEKLCKYCPENQYFNPMTRRCELCPEARPLLVNHVCQACPQGTKYNPVSFRCESLNCVGGALYKYQINDCYCPDSKKPFYNGRQCVSCLSPNRWDLTSRSCVYGSPTLWNTASISS